MIGEPLSRRLQAPSFRVDPKGMNWIVWTDMAHGVTDQVRYWIAVDHIMLDIEEELDRCAPIRTT